MDFDRLALIPRDTPPDNPTPGEMWVPKSGSDAGELHVWSPRRGGWLNLFDDRIVRLDHAPSWWRRALARIGLGRA
ncbi:MAG: hypothetical protein H0W83_04790 [Planctomycetes bacterium]|nr:hypothetical protein [Planctomycetota bacterium]